MKTMDDYFSDWESHVFGFGYGTGEEYVLGALQAFMAAIKDGRSYGYTTLEETVTPTVTWLLINTLAHADLIEYGTSPRFGWLTAPGRALRAYVCERSVDQLVEITNRDSAHEVIACYPDYCNCDDVNCLKLNPFWPERLAVHTGAGDKC